jgi:hypothetical protein
MNKKKEKKEMEDILNQHPTAEELLSPRKQIWNSIRKYFRYSFLKELGYTALILALIPMAILMVKYTFLAWDLIINKW